MRDAKAILEELRSLGALGPDPKAQPPSEVRVESVEFEQGSPGASLVDVRGERMVEGLDRALLELDKMIGSLEGLRTALEDIRAIWSLEDVADGERESDEPVGEGRPETAPVEPTRQEPLPPDRTYEQARAEALKKIRGDDIPDARRAMLEEEEAIPYVGQVRATPGQPSTGEMSIGTLGTVKPSFPTEGGDGA